jgi:hypothetical protein
MVMAFALGAAVLTTFARSHYGATLALSQRYTTPVIPLLFSAALILAWLWRSRRPSAIAASLALLVCALALLSVAARVHGQLQDTADLRNYRERTMVALAAGYADGARLPRFFCAPDAPVLCDIGRIDRGFQRLRADRKSLFSEPWVAAVGGPLDRLATRDPAAHCDGTMRLALEAGFARRPVARYQPGGLIWAPRALRPTPTIAITDAAGRMVGVGRAAVSPRDVIQGVLGSASQPVAWRGELQPGVSGPVTANLLIDGGRRWCPFAALSVSPDQANAASPVR